MPEFYAHKNDDGKFQTLKEHLQNTAIKSRQNAIEEMKDICYLIGLLHDIGKYQPSFQTRINGDTSVQVEHATCGAKLCDQIFANTPLSLLAKLCITGHHTGIPDCGNFGDTDDKTTLNGRLKRTTEDFSQYADEISLPSTAQDLAKNFNNFLLADCRPSEKSDVIEKFAFFVRYCFSCLTDADSIDTMEFCASKKDTPLNSNFSACLADVDAILASFKQDTELQKARTRLQKQVFDKLAVNSNIYLLNMPTGSGKTLCSVKFALERAIKTGKKRIIYVIPYNSIIEQTANLFENIFTDDAQILRHSSLFSYENAAFEDNERANKNKIACENWNAEIIITTAVQFFESVYDNKRSKLRKLHNMADSVIIFDEVHLMPIENLQPCLRAVSYITKYLNSEALFLTATMPDYKTLIQKYAMDNIDVYELINNKEDFSKFNKCKFNYLGAIPDTEIISKASRSPSSLIVVNSRKGARQLFSLCGGQKFHLSTYMSAFDRSRTIEKIKSALAELEAEYPTMENVPPEKRITVVSTSLIEAGVDLDFCTVFRELTGLDNILQAGGRCNREGKRTLADVCIFERADSLSNGSRNILTTSALITKGIFDEFSDISCPDAVTAYYNRLFKCESKNITQNSISCGLNNLQLIPFETYSLKMISTSAVSIVVARDEISQKLIKNIKDTGFADQRKLQKYCFSVYPNEFELLKSQGAINDFDSGIFCITNPDYYDDEIGVVFEGKDLYL